VIANTFTPEKGLKVFAIMENPYCDAANTVGAGGGGVKAEARVPAGARRGGAHRGRERGAIMTQCHGA
jgi:hypothetical protein